MDTISCFNIHIPPHTHWHTLVAASAVLYIYSWRWTRTVSETCRVLINQLKQAASHWLFAYTIYVNADIWLKIHRPSSTLSSFDAFNPFQPKLILVHTTITGTSRRAYKTCKNWPLCSYVGWHQHSQPNTEKSAQCAKMTTGANGQKACILRTDEKHDAIWHHGAGKG